MKNATQGDYHFSQLAEQQERNARQNIFEQRT